MAALREDRNKARKELKDGVRLYKTQSRRMMMGPVRKKKKKKKKRKAVVEVAGAS